MVWADDDRDAFGVAERPVRPASAGSLWRNPGRLRMKDIEQIRTAGRNSRPSRPQSAPLQSARMPVPEKLPVREMLSKVYTEKVESGCMQYTMKFTPSVPTPPKKKQEQAKVVVEPCPTTEDHMAKLQKDVYLAKCSEICVKANSGIMAWLSGSQRCICQQEAGNFRNLLLGNRGIEAAIPLLDSMKSLKCLSLVGNSLRDAGVKAVLSMLATKHQLPQLSVFDLSHNPLSANSGTTLQPMLQSRERLLLLGLEATSINSMQRQQLLMKAREHFENASAADALEAWRLANSHGFADSALKSCCNAHVKLLSVDSAPIQHQADSLGSPTPPPPPQRPAGPPPKASRKVAAFMPMKTAELCHQNNCKCNDCLAVPTPAVCV